ncbi:hypothetical protein OAK65_02620 [Synechococcus sp. AH-551-N17]|nr:hypothetical protein [Synechococcus sp. AH-551-N17]
MTLVTNSGLFLAAFGGGENDKRKAETPLEKSSTELFQLAFGQDPAKKDYEAPAIVDYELNVSKADPTKLLLLDSRMKEGVQYRDLEIGLRDMVKPKRPLAKELRKQEDETGMTLDERQTAFNALQFNVDYLASLADAGLPATMIHSEYLKLKERFPEQAIDESLQETHQQVLSSLKAQEKVQEYKANEEAAETSRLSVEAEIKAAQEALGLQHLSANQVDSAIRGSEAE